MFRFQANESVQKTISNNIRYTADKDDKAVYHRELEEQIRERKEMEALEKQNNREVCRQLVIISLLSVKIRRPCDCILITYMVSRRQEQNPIMNFGASVRRSSGRRSGGRLLAMT